MIGGPVRCHMVLIILFGGLAFPWVSSLQVACPLLYVGSDTMPRSVKLGSGSRPAQHDETQASPT